MTAQLTAIDTYLQPLPLIREKIEALRQPVGNHFGHNPDAIHVGDLGRVGQALDDLLMIFDSRAE